MSATRGQAMAVDQRLEVERILTASLLEMGGDIAGDYFPLKSSASYFIRPGGMTEDEYLDLVQCGLVFAADDPNGRGVFATTTRDAAVWINESQDVAFVARPGSSPEAAASKVRALEAAVYEAVRALGYTLV